MRVLAAVLLVSLVACAGGDTDPSDTDDDTTPGSQCQDNPDVAVPEDRWCLWEPYYSGCVTSRGVDARQVYWQMEGSISEDGTFTGTEQFWWFFPDDWNATDCSDTMTVTGTRVTTDLAQLGCETCEEAYQLTREVTDDGCALGYGNLYAEDQDGYKQLILVDTKTSNGEPNEENKILVLYRATGDNGGESTEEYARGNMEPSGDEHGPPYTFTWEGSSCLAR